MNNNNDKPKRKPGNPNFYKGMKPLNPGGRKKGSVNKYVALSRKLMSEKGPEIVEKVIELAMNGDKTCLKMCMDRILPTTKAIDYSTADKGTGNVIINVGGITDKILEVEAEGELIEYEEGVVIPPMKENKKIVDIDNHKPSVEDILSPLKIGDD